MGNGSSTTRIIYTNEQGYEGDPNDRYAAYLDGAWYKVRFYKGVAGYEETRDVPLSYWDQDRAREHARMYGETARTHRSETVYHRATHGKFVKERRLDDNEIRTMITRSGKTLYKLVAGVDVYNKW